MSHTGNTFMRSLEEKQKKSGSQEWPHTVDKKRHLVVVVYDDEAVSV